MSDGFRTESDSMGPVQIPNGSHYGAQTARAVENFPVSALRFPRGFIRALALVKKHAARTNVGLGLLDPQIGEAIAQASAEVASGRWDGEFVVDVFQTGSGTSTNMNANEVIANRAIELMGGQRGDRSVHPNDHVNQGQSSNDVIPTALHLAALDGIFHHLVPALEELREALASKSQEFHPILKTGRTHLQDATPIRLGQEFSGFARQIELAVIRLRKTGDELGELALGGTAVGTGINTHREFAARTINELARETGLPLREAENHFEAQAARDACVQASATLRTVSISLHKIANDIRFLGSGPRCGLGELVIPATQPGSSIMPGKVNPVMCEMLMMVCAQIHGNDATVAFSGAQGNFQLNVMMPVMAHNLLQSIDLLSSAVRLFTGRCVRGLAADGERCAATIEQSLSLATSLAPIIGYDAAAAIAKEAHASGRTIRAVARERSGLDAATLEKHLDPASQTEPGGNPGHSAGG
jgi:fumarate hydratase, class II